jgi:hypothetical protein
VSIKQQAHEIVDALPDDADWNELVKSLYRNQKITLGMTDLELTQKDLSEAEISTIMGRLESSSSRPDDMRDTRSYNPGNAATLGMVAGIVAIFFAGRCDWCETPSTKSLGADSDGHCVHGTNDYGFE